MKKVVFLIIFMITATRLFAEEKILKADFRHRPPEMMVAEANKSGPLKDIIEEAAEKIGCKIKWRIAPFARSLQGLKIGKVDIVPRTIKNKEREVFVNYLGPIGYQQKDLLFLIRKGQEGLINSYEDLHKFRVGVKQSTAYFDRFNHDPKIKKIISIDDENMAKMFVRSRFDTMIILDKKAIELALANIGFTDYSYANYKYIQKIGNYYGMSKKSLEANIYLKLNEILLEMAKSGRVTEIYKNYNLNPPRQD
ncbi:substrate-binding periplasmic protein [Candidatus Auribacterota bacterium]